MADKEYHEEESELTELERNPESLRDDDEISDAEEAFMEGYESELEEDEEEEKQEDEFDI
ncbi:MAG: hypothetical protein ACP5NW_05910 [Candidatus Woesearchaeota archaeon]